ncbi:MAG: DUF4249 domain-containing protein [Flavobacteriaceae bacterium]
MARYIFFLTLVSFLFQSCEDIIDVEVPTGQTRLVIEASLDWEKETSGNAQTVKLSTTTPYFETGTNSAVTNATVTVTNLGTDEVFNFTNQNDGTYTTNSFVPILNNEYQLEVIYNNQTYTATETLTAVPDIKRLSQSTDGGFDSDLLEVNVYFDDPADEDNFYLIRYYEEGDLFPYFEAASDEFSNGNEMHDFFEKDDDEDNNQAPFQVGDVVDISLYGISEPYYNYMRILLEQYYSGGSPFSSNAAEIKGNCINTTNADNYPYGYFRATQVVKVRYTFQ